MKEQLYKLLNSKKLIINDYIIRVALDNNLKLDEFLVLVYFDNSLDKAFEVDLISSSLGLDEQRTMEAFNSLMIKGLVTLESIKDVESRYNEVVNLNGVYDIVSDNILVDAKKDVSKDIFRTFQEELGRPISPMEIELINGWLLSGTNEDIVLGALREAVYNGVSNFRYIDKIIYEWTKKGFKNMDDVNNYLKNRRSENDKSKSINKREEDILDFDWLDEE